MKKFLFLNTLTLLFSVICVGQNNYGSYLAKAKNALTEGRYNLAIDNAEIYKDLTGNNDADDIIKEAQAHIRSGELIVKANELFIGEQYNEALASYIEAYELIADENTYSAIEKSAKASLANNKITVSKSRGEKLYEIYRKSSAPVDQSIGILTISSRCPEGGKAAMALGNYYKGKENYDEAAKYYETAKSQGLNVNANLGMCYYYLSTSETGNKEKYEKLSFDNFLIAAENNERSSQYNVGLYYMQGRGTAKNIDAAKSWFEKAYINGDENAKKWLDNLNNRTSTEKAVVQPENTGITVSGHVRDSKGPLVGSAVLLSTTDKICVMTGLEGEYTISNIPENGVLAFVCVGYITKKIKVDGKTTIDVVLQKEPGFFEKLWDDVTEDNPLACISLVSDFSKFPIGLKGDFLWGPFHLGADISVGSNIFAGAYYSELPPTQEINGIAVETIVSLGTEEEKVRGTFCYTVTPGIFYKYVSLDCGIGQIWTKTSRVDLYNYSYSSTSNGSTKLQTLNSNSYFVYKPGITAVIGDKDEMTFILSARYRICPRETTLNGFELSLGIAFSLY